MLEKKDSKKNSELIEHLALITKQGFEEAKKRVDKRFDKVDKRLTKIEATMATKDYLDDKLADLRGDLVVLVRKEDRKVIKLVEILRTKNVLVDKDVSEILKLEPFARCD